MHAELLFKALADNTRRRILHLVSRVELSVSELVDCLRQPQSTVSRHLKVLRDAGLIHDRREGTAVRYAMPDRAALADTAAQPLPAGILEWVSHQQLPKTLQTRLDRVLNRRAENGSRFFSRIAHRWDRMRVDAFGDAFHLEALNSLLPAGWVVADIGTGTGFLLPTLARTFRRVIAVDPVPEMLEVARNRCQAGKINNVLLKQGDLSRLPILNERVDLVLAVLVLHHVPSPPDALAEIRRVLKPHGRLLIVEQTAHRFTTFHERMQDRWWGFEPAGLARELEAAGFDQVSYRELDAEPSAAAPDQVPDLFVMTARRLKTGT